MASHWHDDHIRGISSVFDAATSSIFSCTAAVRSKEFEKILSSWRGTRFLPTGSGVDEISAILRELSVRRNDTRFPAPKLASSDKLLWQRQTHPVVSIKALSPSDAGVVAAIARLGPLLPKKDGLRRRLPGLGPNDCSVVLAVSVGNHKLLLGADLEVHVDPSLGWSGILETSKDEGKHDIFKVPHHGSPSSYDVRIWEKMLAQGVFAVATPFVSGRIMLPSPSDCKRILSHTQNAYLTAMPRPAKYRDSNRTVEKMVTEVTKKAHFVPSKYGHVRFRKSIKSLPTTAWQVELFGDATPMDDFIRSHSE